MRTILYGKFAGKNDTYKVQVNYTIAEIKGFFSYNIS